MRIFMSGIIDSVVGDGFSRISNAIEAQLKVLEHRSYGNALTGIGIIPVILREAYLVNSFSKERRLFKRKEKDADYRLFINLEKFMQSDEETKRLLLIKNIIVSIRDLGRKAGKSFDAASMEEDILGILGVEKEMIEGIELYDPNELQAINVSIDEYQLKYYNQKPSTMTSKSAGQPARPKKVIKNRIIMDIRFYNIDYRDIPGLQYGARIARFLRNYGFSVGEPDHVYFLARPELPVGTIRIAEKAYMQHWIANLEWGIPPEFRTWPSEKSDEYIISSVFQGLEMLNDQPEMLNLLSKARDEIATYGTMVKISCRRKETKNYTIEVGYMISPQNGPSVGIVSYLDRKSGKQGEKVFVELQC